MNDTHGNKSAIIERAFSPLTLGGHRNLGRCPRLV